MAAATCQPHTKRSRPTSSCGRSDPGPRLDVRPIRPFSCPGATPPSNSVARRARTGRRKRSGHGPTKLDTNWTAGQVIGGALDVHRYLGPARLEHTYEVCLEAALRQRGLKVQRQVPVRVRYLDVDLPAAGSESLEGREEWMSSDPPDPSDASVSRC